MGELLEAVLPLRETLDGSAVSELLHATGGNPLRVHRSLVALGGGAEPGIAFEEALSLGLSKLPEEALELLRVVCALGHRVSAELLETLVDGEQMFLAIELLIHQGFLVSSPGHRVSPIHSEVSRFVLDRMPDAARKALHGRLLQRLEEREESAFVMAYQAEAAGQDRVAIDLYEQAGDSACRWSDEETGAFVHYQRALHLARWHLLLDDRDESYLSLKLKMGDALLTTGHVRAAEVVFKEVLGDVDGASRLARHAQRGLVALEKGVQSRRRQTQSYGPKPAR